MIAKRVLEPCRVLWITSFACIAYSAAVSQVGEVAKQHTHNVPVFLPTVHAAIVEAPFKTDSLNKSKADAGVLGKIKRQFGSFFDQTSHNKTASKEEAKSGNDTTASSGAATEETNATMDSGRGTSPVMSPGAGSEPLKPSSSDIVTTKMRLVSFLESISASLEDMRMLLKRALRTSKINPSEIISLNDTMLVAAVSGRRFYSKDGSHKAVPVRAVFHKRKLTVEIEELSFIEHADNSNKVSEETEGIGREYHFLIKNAQPIVEDIILRPVAMPIPGYQIIVPLRKESKSKGKSISRTTTKMTSPGADVVPSYWGTGREEDEYEFLRVQMACQKTHGASGIRRMLCTCDKVHGENLTRRLLCVSRIADKVVKVAKDHSEVRIASKIYRGSTRCRNARYGVKKSHDCLVKLLEDRAGESSKLHVKHGRSILTKATEESLKIDELLSKEKIRAAELTDFGSDQKKPVERWSKSKLALRALTFLLYVSGIGFLLLCLFDLGQQYHHHNTQNRSDGHLSRLPVHAQALYARLTLRN